MDAPLELVISVYNDAQEAEGMLKDLRREASAGTFKIKEAAIIVKDRDGHAYIRETDDVKPSHGALFGAITGAVIGWIGGPVGAVVGAVAGAATGGATAAVLDMGFSDDQLKEIRNSMPPGSSALVVMVEHTWVEKVMRELEQNRGKLFRHEVDESTLNEYERQAARR